jgi:A/G-specific adenine glycosylase
VELSAALLDWYDAVRRDLPWRRTSDPYAILVSEVMCQQTQVARVVPRWEAWMARWPTAEALAAAELADVLRAWVGLGYNRRAVWLWEAAGVVAESGWPEDLRTLPGVGPYTAAAIGAFAFGRDEVAVDVNVARVCARVGRPPEAWRGSPRPGDLAQALMELGALVRRARAAACAACPLAAACPSAGQVEVAPRAAAGTRARVPFEATNRWVRGRVVAALAAGEALPGDVEPARLQAAVEGLVRDGVVRRTAQGLALG